MRPLVPFPYDNRHHPLNRIPIGHIRIETYLSHGGLHMPEISLYFVQEQPDGVGGCMYVWFVDSDCGIVHPREGKRIRVIFPG